MSDAVVPVVVVHGGAGHVAIERRARHRHGCELAASAGLAILRSGGTALDAAVEAVRVMEDDPVFNAGTGGSLTSLGTLELDAAVMEGATLRAGGVCALPPFVDPIAIARAVLDDRHDLYAGAGAARFAEAHGFMPADPGSMITEHALARLERWRTGHVGEGWAGGTVGAVVCDAESHVAAATSTGGTIGKEPGRVGDSPIIGAGTYADDAAGAVSATGIGETILRGCLASEVCSRMRAGKPAPQATKLTLVELEARVGLSGGLIVVDALGDVGIERNTETMSHAVARLGERVRGGS